MKQFVLEDSSFVIAVMDKDDCFHRDAVYVFKELLKRQNDIKVLIPSVVFFESLVTLVKKGLPEQEVESKFWKFLHLENVINVSVIETMAFKLCRRLGKNSNYQQLKTSDFLIANTAIEYDAQILTFDKQMRNRIFPNYAEIYYCSEIGLGSTDSFKDESAKFLKGLDSAIKKL